MVARRLKSKMFQLYVYYTCFPDAAAALLWLILNVPGKNAPIKRVQKQTKALLVTEIVVLVADTNPYKK